MSDRWRPRGAVHGKRLPNLHSRISVWACAAVGASTCSERALAAAPAQFCALRIRDAVSQREKTRGAESLRQVDQFTLPADESGELREVSNRTSCRRSPLL